MLDLIFASDLVCIVYLTLGSLAVGLVERNLACNFGLDEERELVWYGV